ncbi:MAG: DUF1349 domain-containing protein [Anaerolineae bacterium]|nr:DUF1349 domain-containing protein [Anaerolineae bacterium]
MQWYNEPPAWSAQGNAITIHAAPQTDFWRKTHDGGIRDNGHFYYRPVRGDFVAQVRFSGDYSALYDQAGLMIRVDAATWLKGGVEFVGDVYHASVVVTRDYSDWSVVALEQAPPALWLRVVREGHTFAVTYSLDGVAYTMLRQAYLTDAAQVGVGLMACAPTGQGFAATFEGFEVRGAE